MHSMGTFGDNKHLQPDFHSQATQFLKSHVLRLPTASLQLTVLLSEASSRCFEAITSIHTLLYLFVCVLYFEAGIHPTSPFSASSVSD